MHKSLLNSAVILLSRHIRRLYFHSQSQVIEHLQHARNLNSAVSTHSRALKFGFLNDTFTANHLVNWYVRRREIVYAYKVFDEMREPNVVSWTALIAGYVDVGDPKMGLMLFRMMFWNGVLPNAFTIATVVNACSVLADDKSGRVIHALVETFGLQSNTVVCSALVDMYGKSNCVDESRRVFDSMFSKNVVSWTSMIAVYAQNGQGQNALELFREFKKLCLEAPNHFMLTSIINACASLGRLALGKVAHGVVIRLGHDWNDVVASSLVDMYAKCGCIAYSEKVLHGRIDIAAEAAEWLIKSKQQLAASYVTMSNAYALAGKWDNLHSIRSEMKRNGVHKEPGCSWIEVKDSTCIFYAGDLSSCARGDDVLNLLRELERKMKERGYVGGSAGLVFVDVEDEAKEEMVGLHSERLALAFGLLTIPKGLTIRVMKNLRMCRDCHEAFKLISDIVERDFVVTAKVDIEALAKLIKAIRIHEACLTGSSSNDALKTKANITLPVLNFR
ncbi:Pentatricopeptide repeat [Dillenia turbinata]|uniref:Pentatricopeptide repeat n=1 Tax=Dillenia turbinata TaxID=194707 RepID=A0AAN8UL32_9MAGN